MSVSLFPHPVKRVVNTGRMIRAINPFVLDAGLRAPLTLVPTVLWGDVYILADPAAIHDVLNADPDRYVLGPHSQELGMSELLGGSALIFFDGEEHTEARKQISRAFAPKSIQAMASRIREAARRCAAEWPEGTVFSVEPYMRDIALDVIVLVTFGDIADAGRKRELLSLLPDLPQPPRLETFVPVTRHTPRWKRFYRIRERARELIEDEVRERVALRNRGSSCLEARKPAGQNIIDDVISTNVSMPMKEIVDLVVLMLVAGHETSTTGLAWMLERVSRSPAVLERLGQARATGEEEFNRYVQAVVKETLRVRPVLSVVARKAASPQTLLGRRIKSGDLVLCAGAAVQRSAGSFPDPEAFVPERWLESRPVPGSWIPFGGGRHVCLGSHLAMMEMGESLKGILDAVHLLAVEEPDERQVIRYVTQGPSEFGRIRVARTA